MPNTNRSPKNVLLIMGSPHKNGSTAAMVEHLRSACPSDWLWQEWMAFDHNVIPCDDCRYCYHKEGCSKPDLQEFYALLENTDILVFASPVYNLSFTTPLKALLDRTQRYWSSRFVRGEKPPIKRPKKAILLTSAEQDNDGGVMLERQLKPTLTILNAQFVGGVHQVGTIAVEDIDWPQWISLLDGDSNE